MSVGMVGDRRQETGDRRPETGDRRPETGDRRQETGDKRQACLIRSARSPDRASHPSRSPALAGLRPSQRRHILYALPLWPVS
ncbi:MAG: hypothetical protein FJ011_26335 [Chloroflexi bacterium]|nr:hypothetical protein [Chloroflexota bacterium]